MNDVPQANASITFPRRRASFTLSGCSTAKQRSNETHTRTLLLRQGPKALRNRNTLQATFPAIQRPVNLQPTCKRISRIRKRSFSCRGFFNDYSVKRRDVRAFSTILNRCFMFPCEKFNFFFLIFHKQTNKKLLVFLLEA